MRELETSKTFDIPFGDEGATGNSGPAITVLAHNITSPLGATTSANYDAVMSGRTALRQWNGRRGVPGTFVASLFPDDTVSCEDPFGLSPLERLALASARRAVADAGITVAGGRTLLILSTTKGNIAWLGDGIHDDGRSLPSSSARVLASRLGITTEPVVVDNACISGLSAIITASRLLMMGLYDHAVVVGAEVQSKFIISGFQSLKAMSAEACRPFDMERTGLNLGDAAATIVLTRTAVEGKPWRVVSGSVRNDAYHLSAPSKNGEGACEALTACVDGCPADSLAFISAHGTATLFNDQMESVAIERAGLGSVPVSALKGYYGHTMGACGVLETALSMCAIDHGSIPPVKGFSELGVSGKISVVPEPASTGRRSFVKMLSGFGGCNAAALFTKLPGACHHSGLQKDSFCVANVIQLGSKCIPFTVQKDNSYVAKGIHLDSKCIAFAGHEENFPNEGRQMLTDIYKKYVGDYPRFFKMDILCRLGFIATELLLRSDDEPRFRERSDRAVVLVGHSGSIVADRKYLESISRPDDYYPSPERFVYTLPNIVTGEIAIRNHYHGETGFYLLEKKDGRLVDDILLSAFSDPQTNSLIGGWINCDSDDQFEADLCIIKRK